MSAPTTPTHGEEPRRRGGALPHPEVASTLPAGAVEAFLARCRRERAEAGLPPKVEDEAVLNRLAVIFATRSHPADLR